jgi:hypothetical protein
MASNQSNQLSANMKINVCIVFCFALVLAGSEKPEESKTSVDRTPKQLFPFYFSVALITLTLTVATTVTTVSTSSTTCTVSTNAACSGKRKRRGLEYDDEEELIPSPVLR